MQAAPPLSSPPISTDGNDWSPIGAYPTYGSNLNNPNLKGFPDTPPISSGHNSNTSTTDGAMQNGARGGNPSPPSSVSRGSVDSRSIAGSIDSRRAYLMEESLSEHYKVLKNFLSPYLMNEPNDQRQNRARDKLLRLTSIQFQELSTDVYDELLRREDEKRGGGPGMSGAPKYLLPKQNFHYKRNQARQKLATLPPERFRQLATDVYYELERRFPRFAGLDGPGSRAGSMMSVGPPRVGTPNGFRPPPRTASRGLPGGSFDNTAPGIQPGLENSPNDYNQPMPKTFQSNTIVPNKSLMVEDDDDDNSARGANGSSPDVAELRAQIDVLERKVDELQGQLREKDKELEKVQSRQGQDPSLEQERSEWKELRSSLEAKLKDARDLNDSLEAELTRVRTEKQDSERQLREDLDVARRNEREVEKELRAQLDDARREGREIERDLRAQLATATASINQDRAGLTGGFGDSTERLEALERELAEQKQTTEEVRRDAARFLQEMRDLSLQSADALEKEERLLDQVSALEREVREWKARYAKLKSQNRSLRASMLGLPGINGDASAMARDSIFSAPDGLIRDVHVTSYQLAIDELLQLARRPESDALIECMKQVVITVRNISSDIESLGTPESSLDDGTVESLRQQTSLRAKLSNAANNLITATKAHSAAAGLAPVSLVDAAASNLTAVVMELVRAVKVKPTPSDELESPESDRDKALPVPPRGTTPTNFNTLSTKVNSVNGHVRNQSSLGSASGYSAYSRYSRYSNNLSPARESGDKGGVLGITQNSMSSLQESSLEEFKNFLDDSTALLVRSIQPLVNSVRSGSADDTVINEYIREISLTVEDITEKTNSAVAEVGNLALRKHAPPVIKVLEKSRIELNQERNNKEKLPPIAFRIARATKELVLRVDRIESGELTVDATLPTEF
ncbi:uncharacterized protein PV09_08683 [Verruconis gallopava]|uniref:GIT Spa2 homology (SHD) domain-containing protein n=1 Tax=Verruconis gallopava TaxID=253628 RepID=A0A0D1ZYW4_9PEZI|nr:uncharacterized protein PV09_08683 [Verruconis gallopava]KIV99617.1 hypothetical protein PV09_08683 [Verruconis gallopava]